MDKALLERAAIKWMQLEEGEDEAKISRCEIAAHFWGDRQALSQLADLVDKSEQELVKAAGAGAVMKAGYHVPDQSREWHYQLSLFRREQWDKLRAWHDLAELSSKNLQHLRIVDEKLRVMGKCLTVEDA